MVRKGQHIDQTFRKHSELAKARAATKGPYMSRNGL